jgi:hypothetical protein
MDPIKEAFARAKNDILELSSQISALSNEIEEIKYLLSQFTRQTTQADKPTDQQTQNLQKPSFQQSIPTQNPFQNPSLTDQLPFKDLKSQNLAFSTGNRGVPTDRQTNQQTDQHTGNRGVPLDTNNIQKVSQLLDSLDSLKREVRFKFKKLTSQEMLVFTTIYQLEEEGYKVDYPFLALKFALTESSIRDYIQKIIKKGIPLMKTKENNKKVFLSISPDLKKIASLSTIISLREI